MVQFTVNKTLEGYINQTVYIRVIRAGWPNWHYVMEETSAGPASTKFHYADTPGLMKMLGPLKEQKVLTEEILAAYLATNIDEEKKA